MHYRTVHDLSRTIVANLHRIPLDVDLVVGIPRSGLLAATLVALHRNLPLTDVEGFLEGRVLSSGRRMRYAGAGRDVATVRRALVLDDSIMTGAEMTRTRQRIEAGAPRCPLLYAAVYGLSPQHAEVDCVFEVCRLPRVFEWNVLNHGVLRRACVDIDGVLCRDPTRTENDDGHRYRRFLETAAPLLVPQRAIGWVVTSRLEKYRSMTEAWLRRHGIRYGQLLMLDLPIKAARIAAGADAPFKAAAYRQSSAVLFIESSHRQACEIANCAGKPVLSIERNTMVWPADVCLARAAIVNGVRRCHRLIPEGVRRLLLRIATYTHDRRNTL